MSETQTLLEERHGRVAILTVNRPDKLNALSQQVRDEMVARLAALETDDGVGVVVVTGAGEKSFVAGADIAEFAGRAPLDQRHAMRSPRIFDVMSSFGKPVIAMINGFCLGGGCEMAASCDLRVASEKARFGQPEIKLGLIPGGGGTQRLPRLIGHGQTMRLVLTGDMIRSDEALRIGLVNRVVAPEELLDVCVALVANIAKMGPLAVAAAKRAIHRGAELPLPAANSLEVEAFASLFETADQREGMRAFLDKREAKFTGK